MPKAAVSAKWFFILLGVGISPVLYAQQKPDSKSDPNAAAAAATSAAAAPVDAAAKRNENVWASRVDNEALKADATRLGSDYRIIPQANVESGYYAAEFGRSPSEIPVLSRQTRIPGWHAELFETLQNSIFNARSFFQVGSVLPSRSNQYGARFSAEAGLPGAFSGSFTQRKVRGMVNGNILVPLVSERTPLATGESRAIVARFLEAYPEAAPNRPDIDPRMLNTNAPQISDEMDFGLRLDKNLDLRRQMTLSHALNRQRIDAAQFVAGKNPDSEIHTHRSGLTFRFSKSEATEIAAGMSFARTATDLHSEPDAVGPKVRIGGAIEDLGPDSQYPIKRAQNTFRWGTVGLHRTANGRHTLSFGGDFYRYQINGKDTYNQRGYFLFSSNFGRTAIENLRLGVPVQYEISLGNMHRGFRSWQANAFFADQWKATSDLQIYWGLRYSFDAAPSETDDLNRIPYDADWNNISPRFSLAYRAPRDWTLRASYAISYGQIPGVTYSQVRYNAPSSAYVIVVNPDLISPLEGIDLNSPSLRTSPYVISPDLASPYSHQYNLTAERRIFHNIQVRMGYVGSRSIKLLYPFLLNRAVAVEGIPRTSATIDQRRPDQRYYSMRSTQNGGIAYMDAAQAAVEFPVRKGFGASASYTFSKAIDTGSNYIGTAANKDLSALCQTTDHCYEDHKSLSDFDSPHSLLIRFDFAFPGIAADRGLLARILSGWQISGSLMAKSGTPFRVMVGSDGPGYGNVDGDVGDRPNLLDPSILGMTINNPDTSASIISRNRFSYLAPGQQQGDLSFNAFRRQSIQNVNAAIGRLWNWGAERPYSLRFRAEAFNLTNHAQFDEPQHNVTSPSFGQITNTLNDGRILQFSLRLAF